MPPIEVRICALGTLAEVVRRELAGFEERGDGSLVVLCGVVADQPALIGVLVRLRRAGLHIRDVERVPVCSPPVVSSEQAVVARFEIQGRVADLLHLALDGALDEAPATTTLEVALEDDDALFDILAVLEHLAVDIREVHVRPESTTKCRAPSPVPPPARNCTSW